jgi:glucose/arabinose dehydrogenase
MTPRSRIAIVSIGLALVGFLPQGAVGEPINALTPVATGLSSPLGVLSAPDGSGRLFIVQQGGQIRIFDGQQVRSTPFLNISSLVSCCNERGLLGLAFHPQYSSNGFFYINYTNKAGNTVVARYTVSPDPNIANPNSAQIVISIDQPSSNHNGGQLQFGPDGFLYIGMGDGGGSGDPDNRAQNLSDLLGKMLRIDVDGTPPYSIPADNPFVGTPGARAEIWAYGLRNPWRFSFDRLTGDLFIADVGQNQWEEIDLQPAASAGGENYGWRRMEGNHCFNPSTGCNDGTLTLPILEYDHSLGCSVTGGYRYRGTRFAGMRGVYFFADYCSGQIWGATDNSGVMTRFDFIDTDFSITSFGEDESGELYVVDGGGEIHQLAMQGLSLAPPEPGQTGTVNTLYATGATPGSRVTFLYGTRSGTIPISGCPGVSRNIIRPKLAGTAQADALGRASLSVSVPNIQGRKLLFQAIELSSCSDSNLVEYLFR